MSMRSLQHCHFNRGTSKGRDMLKENSTRDISAILYNQYIKTTLGKSWFRSPNTRLEKEILTENLIFPSIFSHIPRVSRAFLLCVHKIMRVSLVLNPVI